MLAKDMYKNIAALDLSGGTVDKNPPASGGDTIWILGPGGFHMPQSN